MRNNQILLFLDFDGVTHPMMTKAFNPENMKFLESIVNEHPEIRIVISSSWREEFSLNEIKEMLGATVGSRVIGITPVIYDSDIQAIRYREVIEYLKITDNEDTKWIAIDDTPMLYKGADASVIYTDPNYGFTKKEYMEVKALIDSD